MFERYVRSPYSHNLIAKDVVLDVTASYRDQIVDYLMLMIKKGNSKSKRSWCIMS